MGKRSNFERIEKDFYRTFDPRASEVLNSVQTPVKYYSPCVGEYDLVNNLNPYGFKCVGASDIDHPIDALKLDALMITEEHVKDADYIIENPPWSRNILHPMIEHFITLKPTWLLFDADWAHTKQASDYLEDYCTHIAAIGRLKWMPGTSMSGKDNCCWYRFVKNKKTPTQFIGR